MLFSTIKTEDKKAAEAGINAYALASGAVRASFSADVTAEISAVAYAHIAENASASVTFGPETAPAKTNVHESGKKQTHASIEAEIRGYVAVVEGGGGPDADEKVAVNAADNTPGYLEDKLNPDDFTAEAGPVMGLKVKPSDEKVAIDGSDTSPGHLYGKLNQDDFIIETGPAIRLKRRPHEATFEPTGFPRQEIADSVISFDDATRAFTITPAIASFRYFIHGDEYIITSQKTMAVPDTYGVHMLYLDTDAALHCIENPTETDFETIVRDKAMTAAVFWQPAQQKALYIADERHGVGMSSDTALYFHQIFGTRHLDGLSLENITADGDGSLNAHATLSVSNGRLRDEDVVVEISNGAPQILSPAAQVPVLFRTGAAGVWHLKPADNFPFVYSDGITYTGPNGCPPYNWYNNTAAAVEGIPPGEWGLREVGHRNFFGIFIVASNSKYTPIYALQGQRSYGTIGDARTGVADDLSDMALGGFPISESLVIAAVIVQTNRNWTNTPKAVFCSTEDGGDYINWIGKNISPSGSPFSHSDLVGKDHDDHQQYRHVSGIRDTHNHILVYNGSGAAIPALKICKMAGWNAAPSGEIPQASIATSAQDEPLLGIAKSEIPSGAYAPLLRFGIIAATGLNGTLGNPNGPVYMTQDGGLTLTNTGRAVGHLADTAAPPRVLINIERAKIAEGGTVPYSVYSVEFDGVDSYLTLGQPADLNFNPLTDEFSISAWFRTSANGTIFAKAYNAVAARQYQLYVSGGTLRARTGGVETDSGVQTDDNQWHHGVMVNYNDAGTLKTRMYVNGLHVGTDQTSGAELSAVDVFIGARRANSDNTGIDDLFSGYIDEVCVFSVALSGTEVIELYNTGTPANPDAHSRGADLVSHWTMGDGDTFPQIADRAGNNNAAMINMLSGDIVGVSP